MFSGLSTLRVLLVRCPFDRRVFPRVLWVRCVVFDCVSHLFIYRLIRVHVVHLLYSVIGFVILWSCVSPLLRVRIVLRVYGVICASMP